jgi:polyphosphate kinase
VELLVPVVDPEHHARLDRILELYLDDAGAWELRADGSYTRPVGEPSSSTQRMLAEQASVRAIPLHVE